MKNTTKRSTKTSARKKGKSSGGNGGLKGGGKTGAAAVSSKFQVPSSELEMVHSDRIREISGYDDAALRRLAAKGIIPRPKISKWPFLETLTKLFAHQQSSLDTRHSTLPIFDSMEACEGSGLLSKSFLQTLKSFGLPGFENSRVDLNKLIPEFERFLVGSGESQAELKSESVASFKEMREKYSAKIAKIDFQEAKGESIPKNTAVDTVRELMVVHHHSYGRMIEEWPSVMAGQPAAKIRATIEKHVEGLKASEAASIAALEKAKGKRAKNLNHD